MKYLLSEKQKEIALYCLLNKKSKKYVINSFAKLSDDTNLDFYQECLREVLNINPLFKTVFQVNQGEFQLIETTSFQNNEILRNENENEKNIYEDDIFSKGFDITSKDRLVRTKLLVNGDHKYLVFSVHHVIFDVFSGFTFLQQLFDLYTKKMEKIALKLDIEESFNNFINQKEIIDKIDEASNYYSNKSNVLKEFTTKSNFTLGDVKEKVILANKHFLSYAIRKQSAIIILAIALTMNKEFSMNKIVIGVPVPNRNRRNKKVISYLVNTLPIYIDFEVSSSLSDLIKDIESQLFKSLRYQSFNFSSKFRKYMQEGYFPVVFTYYPSNFIFESESFKMEVPDIFFPEPVAPIHVVAKENGEVFIKTQIERKSFIDMFENELINLMKVGERSEK